MSGQFIYPPPNSQDVTLNYNYRDSVEVSFETTTTDQIDPYLSLWYYLDGQPWTLGTLPGISISLHLDYRQLERSPFIDI